MDSMGIFKTETQYRENQAILRLFETYVLSMSLSQGLPWRWYAVNIPTDLVSGGIKGDIDIIACLNDWSPEKSEKIMYRVWEVKVSTIDNNGQARSLKSGKVEDTMKQLRNLRRFGAPLVSLLDLYLLEDGFFEKYGFLPVKVRGIMKEKFMKLAVEQFGYQIIPFQHSSIGIGDFGLQTIQLDLMGTRGDKPGMYLLNPAEMEPSEAFSELMRKLDEFYAQSRTGSEKRHFMEIITYCKKCKKLICLSPKDATCSGCGLAFASKDPMSFEHIPLAKVYDWKYLKILLLLRLQSFFRRFNP